MQFIIKDCAYFSYTLLLQDWNKGFYDEIHSKKLRCVLGNKFARTVAERSRITVVFICGVKHWSALQWLDTHDY